MRNAAVAAMLAFVVFAVAVVLALAAREERDFAFSPGVPAVLVAAELPPSKAICERPLRANAPFSRLSFRPGTFGQPGPPLAITVRSAPGGRVLARGFLRSGYRDLSRPVVKLSRRVPAGGAISVCFRNAGRTRLALYGNLFERTVKLDRVGDQPVARRDFTIEFTDPPADSVLSLVPEMFDRASLFKAGWIGPWTFWLLAGGLLIGVPVLLARTLRALSDDDEHHSA